MGWLWLYICGHMGKEDMPRGRQIREGVVMGLIIGVVQYVWVVLCFPSGDIDKVGPVWTAILVLTVPLFCHVIGFGVTVGADWGHWERIRRQKVKYAALRWTVYAMDLLLIGTAVAYFNGKWTTGVVVGMMIFAICNISVTYFAFGRLVEAISQGKEE